MKIRKSNSSVRSALVSVIGFRDLNLDPNTPDIIRPFVAGQIVETFDAIRDITRSPNAANLLAKLEQDISTLDHAAIEEFAHLWAAGE